MEWVDIDFALKKCRETYGMNNAVGWPGEDRTAGRPVPGRTTPIHDHLLAAGAFSGFHSGWEVPEWYAGWGCKAAYEPSFRRTNWHEALLREHYAVTSNVGVADVSSFAKFVVSGTDSTSFLDRLVAGRLPKKEGRASLVHVLTEEEAKVYAELTITKMADDRFLVVTGSGSEGHDLRCMEKVREWNWYNTSIK